VSHRARPRDGPHREDQRALALFQDAVSAKRVAKSLMDAACGGLHQRSGAGPRSGTTSRQALAGADEALANEESLLMALRIMAASE
jgi:hypothetical protein